MRLKYFYLSLLISCIAFIAKAQEYNPYKSIGKKGKILTLSKGRYVEVFDTDSIQRIGTVLFNIRTKKIVKLLSASEVYKKASDNTSASRWYSPDPLAEKYSSLSPYVAMGNNPIFFSDIDGRDIIPSTAFKNSSYYSVYQKLATSNSVYKSMVSPYANSKSFNYNLDAASRRSPTDRALATTQPKDWNLDIRYKGDGQVSAINTSTTIWQLNEKAEINSNGTSEIKGLNDFGRALVLLHESAHAYLQSIGGSNFHTDDSNPIAGGEHAVIAGSYQQDMLKGLTEFRDAGGISISDANLTNLSFYGLQGTNEFDKQFGIKVTDRGSQEYADAVKNVYSNILNPLIYTEKSK
jgi:hypothetical protein